MAVSKEDVVLCYQLLLDRNPESESAIESKIQCSNKTQLLGEFINSVEFHEKHHGLVSPKTNAWVMVETAQGFRIWVNLADAVISWSIINNNFEQPEVNFVKNHVVKGNTALDVGSNIGFFSMLMASIVGKEGKVIGFEPLRFLCEAAQRSLRENHFSNCLIHNVALAGERGEALLVYAPGSSNWGGAFLSFDNTILDGHSGVSVPVLTVLDFVDDKNIDFIKIDVEGAEFVVLNNCKNLLCKCRPTIISEVHCKQLFTVSKISAFDYINFIKSCGYTCHRITNDGFFGEEVFGSEDFEVLNVAFKPLPN